MSQKIVPFTVQISQADLEDLGARLGRIRWPHEVDESGWNRGVPAAYLRRIVDYWQNTYDWRAAEARLNHFPQFTTEIDGQIIHFLHVTSREEGAMPLLLTHGYPGSVAELLEVIEPLVDPVRFGGRAEDAFDVIVPSMPGLGFSNPVPHAGWEASRTAAAYAELMRRLGYARYGLQGSDVGSGICSALSLRAPDQVIGAHISTDPTAVAAIFDLELDESRLDESGRVKLAQMREAKKDGGAYLTLQGTRPSTIGYGFTDSPVLQLAWVLERFKEWANDDADLPEQDVPLDALLTNVAIYWFTKSGASSAQMIYESAHAAPNWGVPSVPMGFAVFNSSPIVRELMDADHRVAHWSEFSEGGHFPGLEAPDRLVGDLREFFGSLR